MLTGCRIKTCPVLTEWGQSLTLGQGIITVSRLLSGSYPQRSQHCSASQSIICTRGGDGNKTTIAWQFHPFIFTTSSISHCVGNKLRSLLLNCKSLAWIALLSFTPSPFTSIPAKMYLVQGFAPGLEFLSKHQLCRWMLGEQD